MKVKLGDRGPIVKEIQERLLKLGFDIGPTFADGNFGQKTAEAVHKFQKKFGLTPSGIVDDKTYEKLCFESQVLGDRSLFLHYPFFKGRDVLELQKILKSFGFNPGPLDGIFGPLTEKAVREFQMSVGLNPDGIVGPKTLSKINEAAKNFGSSSLVSYPQREIGTHPLKGKKIAIDSGHGGRDPGAIGPSGLKEAEMARKIGFLVANLLEGLGATVVCLWKEMKRFTLKERVELVEKHLPDILISIHLNASKDSKSNGCEVLYGGNGRVKELSNKLASIIAKEISSTLGVKLRGAKPRPNLYLLKHSRVPAVIVEPLFISNPAEEAMLKEDENCQKIASAVVRGILKHFDLLKI